MLGLNKVNIRLIALKGAFLEEGEVLFFVEVKSHGYKRGPFTYTDIFGLKITLNRS
jgi:hypothetical protein